MKETEISDVPQWRVLEKTFSYSVCHPSTRSYAKRAIDVIGSLIGLTVLGILFVPIVIAIKLDTPGPVFHTQIRCGYRGKRFRLRKFRSMVQDAEQLKQFIENEGTHLLFKNRHDPRITPVGWFLRCTSLDELPQFWNVLRGEMSLVGTRPPLVDEVSHYDTHHWRRLDVKPGMTGEWQVSGRSNIRDFEQVLALDLRYQDRWTVLYDLRIILKTIRVILPGSGAY